MQRTLRGVSQLIRSFIISIITIEAVLTVFYVVDFFWKSASAAVYLPVTVGHTEINLMNMFGIFLLAVTCSFDIEFEDIRSDHIGIPLIVFLTPIVYRLSTSLEEVYLYLIAVGVLSYIVSYIFLYETLFHPLQEASTYINMSCLLSVATLILLGLQYVSSLIVISIAAYQLLSRLSSFRMDSRMTVDISELIYRPVIHISTSREGVIVSGLIFTAFYWVLVTPPKILVFPGSISPAWLDSLPYLASILTPPFLLAIFAFWLLVLRRLPWSIKHWQADSFDKETARDAPPRPRIRNFSIAFFGWLLAVAPTFQTRITPQTRTVGYLVAGYLLLWTLTVLYSYCMLSPFLQNTLKNGGYFSLTDDFEDLEKDFKLIALCFAPILVANLYGYFKIHDSLESFIFPVLLYICCMIEVCVERTRLALFIVAAIVLYVLSPLGHRVGSVYTTISLLIATGYLCIVLTDWFSTYELESL